MTDAEKLKLLVTKDLGDYETATQYVSEELDLHSIGSGYLSLVFELGNRAVKISQNDKCWLGFAKYAKRHQNRYLPKIYQIKQFDKYFIAIMELLESSTWGSFDRVKNPYILYNMMMNFAYLEWPDYEKILKIFERKFSDFKLEFDDDNNVTSKEYLKHPYVKAIKDMEKITGCRIDMHWDNVMFRGNQLVIIDPIIRTKQYTDHVKQILRNVHNMQQKATNLFRKRTKS